MVASNDGKCQNQINMFTVLGFAPLISICLQLLSIAKTNFGDCIDFELFPSLHKQITLS